jgi:hypothetical protein
VLSQVRSTARALSCGRPNLFEQASGLPFTRLTWSTWSAFRFGDFRRIRREAGCALHLSLEWQSGLPHFPDRSYVRWPDAEWLRPLLPLIAANMEEVLSRRHESAPPVTDQDIAELTRVMLVGINCAAAPAGNA